MAKAKGLSYTKSFFSPDSRARGAMLHWRTKKSSPLGEGELNGGFGLYIQMINSINLHSD
jgi:hypothetical protein